ncbi:MAG: maleylpyruvate isomerase family mycothiol-dependent enzyme [Chloroflexota bacterium]|nr:maleylpyruvate isomerase family mycothiol-dependent enzyme [Chloroflexota bacterium]
MDVREAFDRSLAEVDALVGAVTPGQLGDPTPCAEWDVRALLNHLILVNLFYAAMAEGQPLPPADTDFVGDDHVEAFRRSGRTVRAAFSRQGMQEQGYRFPWGVSGPARRSLST